MFYSVTLIRFFIYTYIWAKPAQKIYAFITDVWCSKKILQEVISQKLQNIVRDGIVQCEMFGSNLNESNESLIGGL